jgi:hypothetical protein
MLKRFVQPVRIIEPDTVPFTGKETMPVTGQLNTGDAFDLGPPGFLPERLLDGGGALGELELFLVVTGRGGGHRRRDARPNATTFTQACLIASPFSPLSGHREFART